MKNSQNIEHNAPRPSMILLKEFNYYLANQDKFVKDYDGKVIVLQNQKIIGVYDSIPEAVHTTQKSYELGTFLVQKVSLGNKDTHASAYALASI